MSKFRLLSFGLDEGLHSQYTCSQSVPSIQSQRAKRMLLRNKNAHHSSVSGLREFRQAHKQLNGDAFSDQHLCTFAGGIGRVASSSSQIAGCHSSSFSVAGWWHKVADNLTPASRDDGNAASPAGALSLFQCLTVRQLVRTPSLKVAIKAPFSWLISGRCHFPVP